MRAIDVPPATASDTARWVRSVWADRPLAERAAVLETAAALLVEEADALCDMIARATGRPILEVWSAEIVPALDALRWLARDGVEALRPMKLSRARLQWYFRAARHELIYEPHGVVGVITPSNSLLFLAVPQVAAALLAGNGVMWKPAPAGLDVAAHVAALFRRAGLPAGTLQLVHGGAAAARDLVIAGVDKLHFTGSTLAGLELYRLQAARGRPAVLELSGRHIAVVLDDADPRLAARGIAWGKLVNGGRNCLSVQLVLAMRGVAPAVVDALADTIAEAGPAEVAGDEDRRLTAIVNDAVVAGARLVAGTPWPALIADVAPGMRVVDEEIQGPILAVAGVASAAQAVAWINQGAHRLSASIWTSDTASGRALARRLDVGQVWINEQLHPAAHPAVTLAGRGRSGFGATRGVAGLMEMVQPKIISEMPLAGPRRHYRAGGLDALDLFRATARLGAARGLRQRLRALGLMARTVLRLAVRGQP